MRLIQSVFFLLFLAFLSLCSSESFAEKLPRKSIDQRLVVGLDVEIDRIEINGVVSFATQEIENVMEIRPGDPLERLKVLRTEENLQALYVNHGFEEVKIRSRLLRKFNENKKFETVLEFTVSEGRPVRIASIQFVLQGDQNENVQKSWKKREIQMQSKLLVSVGDIYNQEKMNENKRIFQELLASAEYIGVKIDVVRQSVKAPLDSLQKSGDSLVAAKWVGIQFQVDLGDRVSFGFRGNTVFTRGHLDGLIDEQRLLGLGKDYVAAIRAKLEEEYRSAGYARVEISPYTIELPSKLERRVVYLIREGPRVQIESIQFEGNSVFSSEKLKKQLYLKASSLLQNGFYVEKDLQKASDLLVEWLKENGYLSARVVTTSAVYPPKPRTQEQNSGVKITVYLNEGDQTVVDAISVQGASLLSTQEISQYLQVEVGGALNLYRFGDGIEKLKRVYRDRGYLDFRIINEATNSLIRYSQENRLATILLQLEEGPQFRVGRVEIEGLVKTDEKVVSREIHLKVGEVLKDSDIAQSERQLRKLGIFSAVNIKVFDDLAQPGTKTVRVVLTEADRGILSYGPGFRNDLGIRIFGQLSYTNLWGQNHTISFSSSANRRFSNYHFGEGQAQIAYSWPWFGVSELSFKPTAAYGKTQYINFSAETYTLAANWDKPLAANLTSYLSYTFENINQFQAVRQADNGQFQVGTITPKMTYDRRDSSLAPTSGFFGTLWADFALPILGSQRTSAGSIGYTRTQMRSDYYWSIDREIVWYFSFRAGYEQTLKADSSGSYSIPLIKEFALGGIASIRGYSEQQLNNSTALTDGSLSYVNYRSQLDLPFAGALKFGVFLDAGNLLVNNFSLGGLRYGTGFGFHYQTPVGPVNFDWGFKIDPQPGEDPYLIHFSVGIL